MSDRAAIVSAFQAGIVPRTRRLRACQRADGGFARERLDWAGEALADIGAHLRALTARLGCSELGQAIVADIAAWRAAGLDAPPDFHRTRETYRAPENGELTLYWGPTRMANAGGAHGYYLDGFVALREEPLACAALYDRFPHPRNICQSTHLLAGTPGFAEGNCIVFFPENIRTGTPVESQRYAVFFFSKFHGIYHGITLPAVWDYLRDPEMRSAELGPADTYEARCVWGYLHDYFHHCGPRPFDRNLRLKTRWVNGLLEEIKVDAQTALACHEGGFAFAAEVLEFVLYERLLRYPMEADYPRNFDSGTGVFLLAWLMRHGALRADGGRARLDPEGAVEALTRLVTTVEDIERLPDDEAYEAATRGLVYDYLDAPTDPGARFAVPPMLRGSVFATLFGRQARAAAARAATG